jgi:hypothetical protein
LVLIKARINSSDKKKVNNSIFYCLLDLVARDIARSERLFSNSQRLLKWGAANLLASDFQVCPIRLIVRLLNGSTLKRL